jgi:hypothetical protein
MERYAEVTRGNLYITKVNFRRAGRCDVRLTVSRMGIDSLEKTEGDPYVDGDDV